MLTNPAERAKLSDNIQRMQKAVFNLTNIKPGAPVPYKWQDLADKEAV